MESFLTQEARDGLRVRHRREKDGRTRDRIKAVLLRDDGWTYGQIAKALLLDEETISKHVEEYKNKHKLSIQTGGKDSKLDPKKTTELIRHLEENTYVTVADICLYVWETYCIHYTVPGMRSWLQKNKFSYKKPKGVPAKADLEKQSSFVTYYEQLMTNTPEDEPVLFSDGVHPTMATKISYGWIRTGQNKLIETTGSRTRMNLIGAIDLESMSIVVKDFETLNSEAMADYFDSLRETYPKAPRIHVILDQGPYNKSEETQKAAKKKGIVLHFLPPYSPNLNPIERLWKIMNEHVRNNTFFKSAKEFRKKILAFFHETWPRIAHSMVDRINDSFQTLNPAV